MTQEEILQMARETLPFNKFDLIGCQVCETDFDPFLLDFAALIIAREREECASRIQNYVDHRIPASQYPELLIEELGGNVIKTRYVEMMCRECGKPTMHMGDRCYGCIQAAQRVNNND